jgi:outer membrane protein OmpA-like peptidoglycan-associated protein
MVTFSAPILPPFPRRIRAALALLCFLAVAAPGLAPAAVETGPGSGLVPFAPDGTALPEGAHPLLDRVASHLSGDDKSRVELLAYASGSNQNSRARRLSLDRALVVRSYLARHGVDQSRVILRALGNRHSAGDGDCVEVVTLD